MILQHFFKSVWYFFMGTLLIASCWSSDTKKIATKESMPLKTDSLMRVGDSIDAVKRAEFTRQNLNKATFLFRPSTSYNLKRMYAIYPIRKTSTTNTGLESFKVRVKREGKIIAQFTNPGMFFSDELLKFNWEKSRRGDEYLFYDLKFKLENGEMITLDTLQWKD